MCAGKCNLIRMRYHWSSDLWKIIQLFQLMQFKWLIKFSKFHEVSKMFQGLVKSCCNTNIKHLQHLQSKFASLPFKSTLEGDKEKVPDCVMKSQLDRNKVLLVLWSLQSIQRLMQVKDLNLQLSRRMNGPRPYEATLYK